MDAVHPDASPEQVLRNALRSGDFSPLVEFTMELDFDGRCCGHEYPKIHRLLDFIVIDQAYRICRCVACKERLFVFKISEAILGAPGVPFELAGKALLSWVRDEIEEPAHEPTDWSRYLS